DLRGASQMKTSRWMRGVGILAIGAVAAAACTSTTDSAAGDGGEVIVVEDNFGEQQVPASAKSIVATDNTSFQTPSDWGVEPAAAAGGGVILVEDNFGETQVPPTATSTVATDSTSFQTLSDWGVELTAGAVTLMPDTSPYKTDADIIDLGSHREPNLEAVVAV